jgi:alkylhydroperoxidase family enzyme
MPFFDLPADEQLSPDSVRMLHEYSRQTQKEVPATWQTYGRNPRIVEARLKAFENLFQTMWQHGRFGRDAMGIASMLIAHARRCQGCFNGSRLILSRLGFDDPAMDAMCANPEVLPLGERDRLFVRFALKVATGPTDLTQRDFAEMADHGFTRDDVQEIIGFSAFWVMNTTFTSAGNAALRDG